MILLISEKIRRGFFSIRKGIETATNVFTSFLGAIYFAKFRHLKQTEGDHL